MMFGICEEDFNYYLDCLEYLKPVEFFENVYTSCFDNESLVLVNHGLSKYLKNIPKITVDEILDITKELSLKTDKLITPLFKQLNKQRCDALYACYTGNKK